MNMEKEFVPYEECIALLELDFNERCGAFYYMGYTKFHLELTEWNTSNQDHYYRGEKILCCAPTFSQAFRWFRAKHKLIHQITSFKYKGGVSFDYDIFSLVPPTDNELGDENDVAPDKTMETYDSLVEKDFRHYESDTYEEAELACLKKLIEIVKNKQNENK